MSVTLSNHEAGAPLPDLTTLRNMPVPVRLYKLGEALLELPEGELSFQNLYDDEPGQMLQRTLPHRWKGAAGIFVRALARDLQTFQPDPYSLTCGILYPGDEEASINLFRPRIYDMPGNLPFDTMISDAFMDYAVSASLTPVISPNPSD